MRRVCLSLYHDREPGSRRCGVFVCVSVCVSVCLSVVTLTIMTLTQDQDDASRQPAHQQAARRRRRRPQVHSPAILAPGVPPQTLDPILGFAGRRERRELGRQEKGRLRKGVGHDQVYWGTDFLCGRSTTNTVCTSSLPSRLLAMFTTWSWRPGQTDGQTEGHRSDAPRHGAGVGTDIQTDGRTDGRTPDRCTTPWSWRPGQTDRQTDGHQAPHALRRTGQTGG